MRQNMQAMKTPKMSATRLTTNPDIDYDRLLEMSKQTLDTPMAPPVNQEMLDSASGMRDLGSLAAALSGAVRGAGSVAGKLPNDFGFDQVARDMGNSRSVDLQNRMALRKQQENDMLEAVKNTGIAMQAKLKAERRVKPISDMDRQIANKRLKQFDPNVPDLPPEMTYGDLEEEPFLAQILGIDNDTSGMNEYQKARLALAEWEAQQNADLRSRGLGIQGVRASVDVEADSRKETERVREIERLKENISETELQALHAGLKRAGVTKLPKSVTRGEVEKSSLYTSILKGAAPTANQAVTQNRLQNPPSRGGEKPDEVKQKVLEQIRDIDNVVNSIKRIRPLKEKVSTGPIDSAVGKYGNMLKEGINQTFGTKMDVGQDRIKLEQEVGTNLAAYVLAMSGKASTDRERKFLQDNMPKIDDGDTQFKVKLDNLEEYMNSRRQIIEKEQEFYGKKVPPPPNVQGNSSNAPKEVRRLTKDGKTAIFDAETKRFIRYAD
jgi:hypothetical protein